MTDRSANWAQNLLHRNATADGPSSAARSGPKPVAATVDKPPIAVAPDKHALAKALLAQRLKKRSRFNDADKAKIFGRFLQGDSPEDIGASFGVSGMTIRKLVDDAIVEGGLEPPKRGRRKSKETP